MRSVLARHRRRARGFTLPELMAVVAIIGVMGAIAMATLSRSGDAENAGAYARSIEFAMMNARSQSISDGFVRRLKCNLVTTRGSCAVEKASVSGTNLTNANWPPTAGTQEQIIWSGSHATLWNVIPSLDYNANNAGGAHLHHGRHLLRQRRQRHQREQPVQDLRVRAHRHAEAGEQLVSARRKRSRGFTLIELLVAMALTTVGLVGLVALQSIAIRGNMMSRNFGDAMGIAQSRLEEAEHTLYANLPAMTEGTCAATSPPTTPTCNGAVLTTLSPEQASTTEAIYSRCTVATTDLTNNKTTIQVTVCWNDLGYNGVTNKTVHAITLYTVRSP